MTAAPRLVFEHVTKSFRDGRHPRVLRDALPSVVGRLLGRPEPARSRFVALDDVSFAVVAGEALGVIGRNGAGKSTTLKVAAGIYRPDSGSVRREGRVAAMIDLSAGFHPDLSGRENVFLSAALLGLSGRETRELLPRMLDFADIGDSVDAPLRVYSTGMVVRLGFAVASHVPAEILLIDEVLAVGDLGFHAKCVDRMAEQRRDGVSVLLVTHHLAVVEQFCDRAIVIDHGSKTLEGPRVEVMDEYRRRVLAEHDGPGKSGDPQVRRGSGEVRIAGVDVLGEDGATGRVVARPPVSGRLRLEAIPGAPSPSLGFELDALDGAMLSRGESPGDPAGGAPVGASTAEVSFRRNALLPGAYVLTVFARDPRGHRDLDVQYKAHRFAVWGERTGGEQGAVSLDAHGRR